MAPKNQQLFNFDLLIIYTALQFTISFEFIIFINLTNFYFHFFQMKRSKKAVPEELKNPWIVENLEEFLYYCCPECDVKSKDTQSFIEHALINHAQAQHLVVVKIEEESDEPLNIDGTVVHLIDATESQSVLPEEVEPEDTLETQTIEEGKLYLELSFYIEVSDTTMSVSKV